MEYIIFAGQLILSAFLGSILGLQRHRIGKAAGARTFAMLSLGSTLFTLLSLNVSNGDPSRIAAQILTGIGFIGAGTIIHKEDTVEGLTTAAGLWSVTAVGMAIGFGWYLQAIIAAVIMFVVLAIKTAKNKWYQY